MTEHVPAQESREAGHTRMPVMAGSVIVAVAAGLRFWALAGGLPSTFGVDEPQIMVRAITMLKTGDPNPHFFDYPGLYIYLQAMVAALRFLAGASSGEWSSLAQVNQYDFYVWGRAVTATFGTATVYLVYRIGTRWGVHHGLLAAGLFALMPFHVRESHFVLTDVPMTFFVVLAMLLSLRAHEKPTAAAFCRAGIAAGLAAGTKYTGGVSILLPIVAAVMTASSAEARLRNGLAAVGAFVAAYLAVAPYTLLDMPAFLDGFAHMANSFPVRGREDEPGLLIYFTHLRINLGWPCVILAGAGVVLFVVRLARGPDRARAAMVLAFLLVFYSMVANRTLIYARYMMPALPFICLLIAMAITSAARLLRHVPVPRTFQTVLIVCVIAVTIVQPAMMAVAFNRDHGRRTTYADAAEWIQHNVNPGARIVSEASALRLTDGRYEFRQVRSLSVREVEYYVKSNADYVIASSQKFQRAFADPARYNAESLYYSTLFQHLVPAATFAPSRNTVGPELRLFIVPK